MQLILRSLFTASFLVYAIDCSLQPVPVDKNFEKTILVHYMPWFESPEFNGQWGWHWTMNNRNPEVIVDSLTGRREIASHYYPMIGPYSSLDPDVIDYHLLLIKYTGLDGVMIDWYGIRGSNGDINSLLVNSNALIERLDELGLSFGIVLEDRFAISQEDVQSNLVYAKENYFVKDEYLRYGDDKDPLVAVFGPTNFQTESDWDQILEPVGNIELLSLWYEKNDLGKHADGEYIWIYEDESQDDYYQRLSNFYTNRAPGLKTVMGAIYPGFNDFYEEGGAGPGFFDIPHLDGQTLLSTIETIESHINDIDLVQLVTWNDYGEGTIFEPTLEFRFQYLLQMQAFLEVDFGLFEYEQILRLYRLRKEHKEDAFKRAILDEVFIHLTQLQVDEAVVKMDGLLLSGSVDFLNLQYEVFPNPVTEWIYINGSYPFNFQVTDINGRSYKLPSFSNRINVSSLDQGYYVLHIKANETRQNFSFIKY